VTHSERSAELCGWAVVENGAQRGQLQHTSLTELDPVIYQANFMMMTSSFYRSPLLVLALVLGTLLLMSVFHRSVRSQDLNGKGHEWMLAYADEEAGTKLYYAPKEIIREDGGTLTGWVKFVSPGTGKTPPSQAIFHQEWDCAQSKYRILQTGGKPSEWERIDSDTINDYLLKKVCSAETGSSRKAASASNQKGTDDARDWVLVFADEKSGTNLYYSPNQMMRARDGLLGVWVKIMFPETKQGSPDHLVFREEWNCKERKYRVIHQGVYGRDGSYDSIDEPTAWEAVVSGTPNDYFHKRVCSQSTGSDTSARSESNRNQKDNDEWKFIGAFGEGKRLYYSPAKTVREPDNLIRAWFKVVMPKTDKGVSELVLLEEFNCKEGMLRDLQTTVYYRDRKTETENKAGDWKFPTPDSTGEIMFATICPPEQK